jgi:UTP--glucose-1-phosphate uridylyltransferase
MTYLAEFIDKMRDEGLPQIIIDTFSFYYDQVISGATGMIPDTDIRPVDQEEIADAAALERYAPAGRKALGQAVMIVLNGGLGTSMGLTGPKSLLTVKDNRSFLQIIIEQAAAKGVRLAFMNSFNTDAKTRAAVQAIAPQTSPLFFLQHKFPKILQKNYSPAQWLENPELEWNPPGHGEIFTALVTSGLLANLLDEGVKYALIANCDNLGATLDPALLGYFADQRFPFMMEVAQRTPTDMKGGHIARHVNGRLILREIAQCPEKDLAAFQDIQYYRFFNVNSLWIDLRALNELVQAKRVIHLPMILNPKTIDPRDKKSPAIYQIETAMGAAIALFEGATAVKVPVTRFRPVKKCADLLSLRSDCFVFQPNGSLVPNPDRHLDRVQVKLDPAFYTRIDDFEQRFAKGVPSLLDCEALTITGDVFFEKDVIVKGNVHLHNPNSEAAVIPQGSTIEGDVSF